MSALNQIPIIFNAYWDMSPFSYMNYLTIKSFLYYHPDWRVNIYVPAHKSTTISCAKNEYTGPDYWNKLTDSGYRLQIIPIDFEKIGFYNDAPEVIKSDYLRYHILGTDGGIWSDFDILYINSLDNTLFNPDLGSIDYDTLIFYFGYYPMGFFLSKPNNEFFNTLKKKSLIKYNTTRHQCIDSHMIILKWQTITSLINDFPQLKFRVEDKYVYSPYECTEINNLFDQCENNIKPKTIGIHWFNDADRAKRFQNNFENEMKMKSTMTFYIQQFEEKVKQLKIIEDIDFNVKNRTFDFVHMTIYNPIDINSSFVTIVMTTYNRKIQTLFTLKSFTRSNRNDKIIVILVDDSTEGYLNEEELTQFPFQITYITIENHKKMWIDPCINYNIGFNEIKTDYVIIQNAEVCHVGDVIDFVPKNLTSENYIVFDVCALPSAQSNEILHLVTNSSKNLYYDTILFLMTQNYSWYQHTVHRNANFHFLTAISHTNLEKLKGFDSRFALGMCYDDDEFIHRICHDLKLKIHNVPHDINELIGIHQWHTTGINSYNEDYVDINRRLYNEMKKIK